MVCLILLVAGTPTHGGGVSQATNAWLKSLPPSSLRGGKGLQPLTPAFR